MDPCPDPFEKHSLKVYLLGNGSQCWTEPWNYEEVYQLYTGLYFFTEISVVQLFVLGQMNSMKQAAQDSKDQAKNLQERINEGLDTFEREKNKTRELIQQTKDYLMGQCTGVTL